MNPPPCAYVLSVPKDAYTLSPHCIQSKTEHPAPEHAWRKSLSMLGVSKYTLFHPPSPSVFHTLAKILSIGLLLQKSGSGRKHCSQIHFFTFHFPVCAGDPWDTFRRTLSGRFYVPNFISDTAADLIFKLLQVWDKQGGSFEGGSVRNTKSDKVGVLLLPGLA